MCPAKGESLEDSTDPSESEDSREAPPRTLQGQIETKHNREVKTWNSLIQKRLLFVSQNDMLPKTRSRKIYYKIHSLWAKEPFISHSAGLSLVERLSTVLVFSVTRGTHLLPNSTSLVQNWKRFPLDQAQSDHRHCCWTVVNLFRLSVTDKQLLTFWVHLKNDLVRSTSGTQIWGGSRAQYWLSLSDLVSFEHNLSLCIKTGMKHKLSPEDWSGSSEF